MLLNTGLKPYNKFLYLLRLTEEDVHFVFLHTQTLEGVLYIGVVFHMLTKRYKVCVISLCLFLAHTTLEGLRVSFTHRTLKDVHYIGCACRLHIKNARCAL